MKELASYRIIEKIASGRNATVYRAVRLMDGHPVILKCLNHDLPMPAARARLEHEYKMIHRLALPCIVTASALEVEQGHHRLVLEDFGGDSLANHLKTRSISLPECLRLAVQLAEALEQLHAQGVIHQHLNPSHCLWNPENGVLKLGGLGFSLLMTLESPVSQNPAKTELTLAYLAPEQTGRVQQPVDQRTDLYCLGTTLYELFTGQPPFIGADAMDYIHAHIARQPAAPDTLKSGLPPQLSAIILKLLRKDPEERYQTAGGVSRDLATASESLLRLDTIVPFELATSDISPSLRIPHRLYGREHEQSRLLEAFEDIGRGSCALLLVTGGPGAGKSSLVQSVQKPIIERHGFYLTGKFNQYLQNEPYTAIQQAFNNLFHHLLTGGKTEVQQWREDLLQALGRQAGVLAEVLPALKTLIGSQPPVETISLAEAERRLHACFQCLLHLLCRPEHPVVLFIDDWQWADTASIRLVKHLLAEASLGHFLVIASYRDNELDAAHPFRVAVDDLRRQRRQIHQLEVRDLELKNIQDMIADALRQPQDAVTGLAELVFQKTCGNPFFAKAFLKTLNEMGLLVLDPKRGQWLWHLEKIRLQNLTENVVDLLLGKLRKFSIDTQTALSTAAGVGHTFPLQTLAFVIGRETRECLDLLRPAVLEGLVQPLDDHPLLADVTPQTQMVRFRFQHDRVQQAAYALTPPDQWPAMHRQIARMLLAELSPAQLEESLFEVVGHLNASRSLISGTAEVLQAVELNFQAATKAKAASAYLAALHYQHAAFHFLSDAALVELLWSKYRPLTLNLHRERAELEFLCGDLAVSEQLIRQALPRCLTSMEKAETLHVLIVQYTLLARYPEAIATARLALATLGVVLPEDQYEVTRDAELQRVKDALGDRPVASLHELPFMNDPERRLEVKLLIAMGPPCYRSHQQLWSVIVPRVVRLSIEYGNVPQIGYSHTAFGGLLGWVGNNYNLTREFGDVATRIMTDTFTSPSDQSVFHLMIGSSVRHWCRHLKFATQDYHAAYEVGVRSNNLQYAAYAFGHNMYCRFFQGVPLAELLAETECSLAFSQARRNQWAIDLLESGLLAFDTLAGKAPEPFKRGDLSDAGLFHRMEANRNIQVTCIYHILKAHVLCMLEDYPPALAHCEQADRIIYTVGTQGLLPWPELVFIHSLVLSAVWPNSGVGPQGKSRDQLADNLNKLQTWASQCPENFACRQLLIAAELARLDARPLDAMELYDQAIDAAKDGEFLQIAALANERAAQFWLHRAKPHLAQPYLLKAEQLYATWGAAAKTQLLRTRLAEFFPPKVPCDSLPLVSVEAADASAILEAAHSFSDIVHLEPLLAALLRLVLSRSGAERGLLLLPENSEWVIQAAGTIEAITVMQASPLTSAAAPLSILFHVINTGTSLVLDAPVTVPLYAEDRYLQQHRPKSICCLLLTSRGHHAGLLYLENTLVWGVFKNEGLALLRLLSNQMAIAILNAQVVEKLTRSQRDLAQETARSKLLFQLASDGIHVLDEEGCLHEFSEAFRGMLGYCPKEMATLNVRDWDAFIPPVELVSKMRGLIQIPAIFETRFRRHDGTLLDVEINSCGMELHGRKFIYASARDITKRKAFENRQKMTTEILIRLNQTGTLEEIIGDMLRMIKQGTGTDAVGLRLHNGDDYPYFCQEGFSTDFVQKENHLCARAPDGSLCRDQAGRPLLECTCGLVLLGRTDPANSLFTPGGSAWTNDTLPFLQIPNGQDSRLHPRNRCLHEGYRSVALIPIRVNQAILGLLQLNSWSPNVFSLELIQFFEGLSSSLGNTLAKLQADEALRKLNAELEDRVTQRTQALQESEKRYRLIAENTTDVLWIYDLVRNRFTYASPSVERLRGFTPEEVLGQTMQEVLTPESVELVTRALPLRLAAFKAGAESARSQTHEVNQVCKNGSIVATEAVTTLLSDATGQITQILGVSRDITARKQTESALGETQRTLAALMRNLPGMAYRCRNDRDWTMEFISEGCLDLTGYPARVLIKNAGKCYAEIIHPEDRERVWSEVQHALFQQQKYQLDYRIITASGALRWVWEQGLGVFSSAGDLIALEGFVANTSDRKKAEENLRQSLEEKTALLKEVHHRVKNNLQIVASMLNLQANRVHNREALAALQDTQNRVASMALLHETLYRSDNLARINFASYVGELCANLLRAHGPEAARINIERHVARIGLPLEQSVPCGLIINELVANSLKHAFPGTRTGQIVVTLQAAANHHLLLQVSDDGVGLPEGFDLASSSTLGLRLITNLATQLEGRWEVNPLEPSGTTFKLVFPVPNNTISESGS
jgi:PAS domain S-box-containing protein